MTFVAIIMVEPAMVVVMMFVMMGAIVPVAEIVMIVMMSIVSGQ